MNAIEERAQNIVDEMRSMDQIVVAFSGGVDSSLVAALALHALGDRARAVTAVSETLASSELAEARTIASEIGIRHETVSLSELDDPRFVANSKSRCFYCQSMRFDQLRVLADAVGCDVIASGTNVDDTFDDRPGLRAMQQRRVYQPLLQHGLKKEDVRRMARAFDLSVWDKPAAACLSSRIPHGLAVTRERLARIERAEDALAHLGLQQLRVRDHRGLARVEVGPDQIDVVLANLDAVRDALVAAGFARGGIDLLGYRPGGRA